MNTPKLAAKMVLAMRAIDAVAKSGTNTKQGYKYVQAADVAHEVRKALIDNGISFDYSVTDTDRWDKATTNGGSMACVQVKVAVTFTDQESGESRTVNSIGWGMDSLDKAPYKAMTGAVKYALRMNFLIPDDADPENDSQDSRPRVQPASTFNQQAAASLAEEDLSFLNDDSHPAENRQVQPIRQAHSVGSVKAISEKQAKRLWAIAKQRNIGTDAVLRIVGAAGYDTVEAIGWKDYEKIVAQVEEVA